MCIRDRERIASAPINGGINLNVSPREHQQGGPELINNGLQHPFHIEHRQGRQIKNSLGKTRKTLVEMIGEIDRADWENWVAREPHEQHPLTGCRSAAWIPIQGGRE